jgi:8-oxo-dGTP pyrophosphatase MutT (NUDIX family)
MVQGRPQTVPALPIRRVMRLDLPYDDWRWPFARERRAEIDAHFARLRETKPELWNGRVLLAREPRFDSDAFHARYFETDFASFIAWRDWGFPDTTVINGFGMGALRGNDGGFVLGEMAPHTANAGKVYFPSGTPDLSDLRDGRVDIPASVAREVAEETGLAPDDYVAGCGWDCAVTGTLVAMIRVLDVPAPTASICARMAAFLAIQPDPELSAVHVVRSRSDITPAMPDFIAAYLAAQFDAT